MKLREMFERFSSYFTNFGKDRSYRGVSWLFLRGLGIISLIAFLSFWVQLEGLIGSEGILPARDFLSRAAEQLGQDRYWRLPTVFWLSSQDIWLHLGAFAGVLASIALIFNIAPAFSLLLIWGLYLSICVVGQVFMQYQWDNLLIETAFLGIFVAPWKWWPSGKGKQNVNIIAIWLLRLLLFKLIFESGMVKLASGDPTWSNLTALNYHFLTQPLPTVFGWIMHQFPEWLLKIATFISLVVEIAVPFLIITTHRLRHWAGFLIGGLMVIIGITGNYGFFNLLGILLCISLFDDAWLKKTGEKVAGWFNYERDFTGLTKAGSPGKRFKNYLLYGYVILYLFVSLVQFTGIAGGSRWIPEWGRTISQTIQSMRTINNYGLFANMTTSRPEIIVQGSRNGRDWKSYHFRYKPGEKGEAPSWVQPHMPRLDWQMWFAALGTYRRNPWFVQFSKRLLQGKQPVLKLLEHNPFPNKPPRYVRARQYDYEFTTLSEWWKTGNWWKRSYQGNYLPVISIKQFR